MKKLNTLHGLFAASLLLAGTASAQIVEDFESGNPDSWQIDFNGTINGFPISAITGTVGGGGNPGNAIGFNAVSEQIGPWFFNSPASSNFSGDLRAKGVTGIACDMNFTTVASLPFGSVFVAMIADDNGTPEVLDDLFCWYYDFSYAYNGFGPGQLPSGTWNHCTWNLDTSSTTLPAGWTINNIAGNFAGDPDTAWNALVTDVDYVAFANGAPWGGFNLDTVDIMFDNITLEGGTVATPYCFCDGSGVAAPCANPGAAGNGCANGSSASGANLSASGNASAGASTLVLSSTGSPAGQPGLFFQGDVQNNGGLGVLFGDGLRCAGGNVIRLEVAFADGSGNATSTIDIAAKGAVSGGQTRYYQYWSRDPAGSPCGALFNTTNGLSLTWNN